MSLPVPRYAALVAGVANRYTANRLPYLAALLEDGRPQAQAAGRRVCDMAVARLSVILNQNFLASSAAGEAREAGRLAAQAYLAAHPESVQLAQLAPPAGRNAIRAAAAGQHMEDTSRMR